MPYPPPEPGRAGNGEDPGLDLPGPGEEGGPTIEDMVYNPQDPDGGTAIKFPSPDHANEYYDEKLH